MFAVFHSNPCPPVLKLKKEALIRVNVEFLNTIEGILATEYCGHTLPATVFTSINDIILTSGVLSGIDTDSDI